MCKKLNPLSGVDSVVVCMLGMRDPPYAEAHGRWCERTINTKIGDKHL